MGLSLTFLGRTCDRWRIRVEVAPSVRLVGLTVSLVDEMGHCLGPSVVAPSDMGGCWIADVRGPAHLPPGTLVRAAGDGADGTLWEAEIGVDLRHGLHAFLHADGRLPLSTDPQGETLSRAQARRLGDIFPWVCGCDVAPPRAECPEKLAELLREFDVDPAELDEELIARMRSV